MSEYTHHTIICPAAFQSLAQSLCEAAAEGDAGKGMFTTGLSATGETPATHYISSGYIEQQFADILPLTTISTEGEETSETTRPGNVARVEGIATQSGVQVPSGVIAALLSAIDVTELSPWHAMSKAYLNITRD